MREILFRGKRTDNGEWVEGLLFKYCGEFCIALCSLEGDDYGLYPTCYAKVDPSTVGQFTGLCDENGVKIFEGDIVKAVIVRDLGDGTENREETGVVGYNKIGMIGLITKYYGAIPVWSDFFQELTLSGCIDDFWFEVIGNVHDNPELLEDEG